MKFSALAFAGFVALAVAQGPPKGGKGPGGKGPGGKGMGGKGGGGFPGGGPGGPGGFPGGGGGGFAKMACAKSCLAPIKDSGCKFPFPKKGDGSGPSPGGPPGPPPSPKAPGPPKGKSNIVERQAPPGAGGDAPPRPKIDPEAIKQFNTCLCTNKGVLESLQTCVPKECSGEGEAAPIFNMYNRMCKSVEGFKPLEAPASVGGGASSAPAPPGGPPKASGPKMS